MGKILLNKTVVCNHLIFLILILSTFLFFNCTDNLPKYKDSTLPPEVRVKDLIVRMSLEEKVGQLISHWSMDSTIFTDEGEYLGISDTSLICHGLGAITYYLPNSPGKTPHWFAKCNNNVQKYAISKSRFGIPVFIYGEALHGLIGHGATSFPQAIALGSTWDTLLVEAIFSGVAKEARMRGRNQLLAPVLDLALDPRWGRIEECYSEDPYLVSQLGVAAVFGFQGRKFPIDSNHVIATLKHFVGHGQPEGGRNLAPVHITERILHENHLLPFQSAIVKANALSVMASYNEMDGLPNHLNKPLLTGILRKEWGFNGYVLSDLTALDMVYKHHLAAANPSESGVLSVTAGVDLDLGSNGCFVALKDEVKKGNISEEIITRAAERVLYVKFKSGLFDHPFVEFNETEFQKDLIKNKNLALKAAHEAMVLLKNDGNILPLDVESIKTLAVIGPNAEGIHLGGYSTIPFKGVSILAGLTNFAKDKMKVVYSKGCNITLNKECHGEVNEVPILSNSEDDKTLIDEAVKVAEKCDAIVLVLGENELINREAWSEDHLGDTDNLDLVGAQEKLSERILALGKPVVVLLVNGRPLTINQLAEKAPAIIECWYLGQETGNAVADIIFGKINPSGKLTVTFPRSVGQIPSNYNKKPSVYRDYVLSNSRPLFPFGFGLSYTSFEYSNLVLNPNKISGNEAVIVTVDVKNVGNFCGDEIVQLYIHDLISLPTRPVMELKDFARISFEPGQSRTVRFILHADKLKFLDEQMKMAIQKGEIEIMVGKSSIEYLTDTLTIY